MRFNKMILTLKLTNTQHLNPTIKQLKCNSNNTNKTIAMVSLALMLNLHFKRDSSISNSW